MLTRIPLYLLKVFVIFGDQIRLYTKDSFLLHYPLLNTLVFSNHILSSLLLEYFKILFSKALFNHCFSLLVKQLTCRGQVFKLFSSFPYPFPNYLKAS